MPKPEMTRAGFIRLVGTTTSALVGLSIAATPRNFTAIVSGKSVLKKVTLLKSLKAGVNGPFPLKVDTQDTSQNQIFLVLSKGKVSALEGTCRHMGCLVAWVGADHKFECPCHGSQYNITGKVVGGPAQDNLYGHKVVVKAGQVWVMTGRATK